LLKAKSILKRQSDPLLSSDDCQTPQSGPSEPPSKSHRKGKKKAGERSSLKCQQQEQGRNEDEEEILDEFSTPGLD